MTVCITFFSLILGGSPPSGSGCSAPRLAALAAPLLDRIATLARPVWLLTAATNLVVAVLGGDPRVGRQAMTEQEVRELVTSTQTLSQDERQIVGEVFDAGKRQIREVLVPRTEVVFLDGQTPVAEAAAIAAGVPHSRLPVYQDTYDNVIGFVHVRDLLGPGVAKDAVPVGRILPAPSGPAAPPPPPECPPEKLLLDVVPPLPPAYLVEPMLFAVEPPACPAPVLLTEDVPPAATREAPENIQVFDVGAPAGTSCSARRANLIRIRRARG